MRTRHLLTLLTLLVALAAFARGGGAKLGGVARSIDAHTLTLEAADHTLVRVALDEKTRFEKDGAPTRADQLAVGDRVEIQAARHRGKLVATRVSVAKSAVPPAATSEAAVQTVAISVTDEGFTPSPIEVKRGQPVRLVVTRKVKETCAKEIHLEDPDIRRALPLNEPVTIEFTPTKSGTIRYSCAMGMMGGVLTVE